jgi:hypothetical protein
MRISFRGPFDDFRRVVSTIASGIAGADVALRQTAYEGLPDRDGYGGTHDVVLEGDGVRVREEIYSNEEGSAREGYGYTMRWTFEGTGARVDATASIRAGNYEPRVNDLELTVSAAAWDDVHERLVRLLGKERDQTDGAHTAYSNIAALLDAGRPDEARVHYERVLARTHGDDRLTLTFLALKARMDGL